MGIGKQLRDEFGAGEYIERAILPLAFEPEPVAFRDYRGDAEDALPFFEELESDLLSRTEAAWLVKGAAGCGRTWLARWAAVRWGRRFLEEPDGALLPVWIEVNVFQELGLHSEVSADAGLLRLLANVLPALRRSELEDRVRELPIVAMADFGRRPHLEEGLGSLLMFRSIEAPARRVTLGPWDRETAFLAAQRLAGACGVERLAALERSPCAALVSYPAYVADLATRVAVALEDVERNGGVPEFIRGFHDARGDAAPDYDTWCRRVLDAAEAAPGLGHVQARLHQRPAESTRGWGEIFRAFLLAEVLAGSGDDTAFGSGRLSEREIDLLALALDGRAPFVRWSRWRPSGQSQHLVTNRMNLHWALRREPAPASALARCPDGLRLPGYPLPRRVRRLRFTDADLREAQGHRRVIVDCWLQSCSLRDAKLVQTRLMRSRFLDCDLRGVDLRRARIRSCRFERALLDGADLRGATLRDVQFIGLSFESVDFSSADLDECRFVRVDFGSSLGTAARVANGSFALCGFRDVSKLTLTGCNFADIDLSGLTLARFETPNARYWRCDLRALSAPRATLRRARFDSCILADLDLHGADLRGASFYACEFQPGPASRCGHTDPRLRGDALHGSKSGFYAEDLAEGIWADPEQTRTADLRNVDLRGARFIATDLFRVDLRGAKLDRETRREAGRMGAFVGS